MAKGAAFSFRMPASDASVSPFPDEGLNRCDLRIRSGLAPAGAPLTLLREEVADPALASFDSRYDRCPEPDPAGLEELDRVFYASRWLSQTCALPLGEPRLLRKSRDGFNAKVEALMGARLPESAFDRADPNCRLISRPHQN